MSVEIPWPTNTNPGLKPQEGTGRLINVYAEPRGDGTPVWRRAPGATVFARNPSSGTMILAIDVLGRSETLFSTFFSLVGSTYAQYGSTGSKTFNFSQDVAAGDLLFLAYAADAAGAMTTPTDWTSLGTTAGFMGASLMYKVSTGEQSVGLTVPEFPSAVLSFSIRGAMSTAPIVDTAALSTGASGDPVPGSITCTTADSLIVTVAWQDDDNASAVVAPATCVVAAATTFGCGGNLFAVTTGANGTNGATVMAGFRPMPSTAAISFSTWDVTGGDDEWAAISFTVRHD